MTPIDIELQNLREEIIRMWEMVITQLDKTRTALLGFDQGLAAEVVENEQWINGMELQIDRSCEDVFALFTPLANDLRFVLAILNINSNLERTADFAESMAKFISTAENEFDEELLSVTQVVMMYEEALAMLNDTLESFRAEDTSIAQGIFIRDKMLDDIYMNANNAVASYIRAHPTQIEQGLYVLSIIRKLERVGDQCKNMAEEIIFYIEAKVVKHKGNISEN